MREAMPAIEVHDLVKHYGSVRALDRVTFDVHAGEVFGLLGPNGAGKTTCVECLEGLRRPDAGSVRVLGLEPIADARRIKQCIGVQLQTTGLYPRLTVREVIRLFAAFYRAPTSVDELLTRTDLVDKQHARINTLSGGQKQRLSLALALVNNPELIFLDEPTTGLDPQARRQAWDTVDSLRAQEKTVLLTTHYMEEAERLCDRVAILDGGKIIALDRPEALIRSHFHEQAIDFRAHPAPDPVRLAALPGVSQVQVHGAEVTLYSADIPATLSILLQPSGESSIHYDDLTIRRATLEDVFLKLAGRRIRE